MYRIIKTNGTELGLTEDIRYIKVNPISNAYINVEKYEATGIIYKGVIYNLIGRDIGAEETVLISKLDSGGKFSDIEDVQSQTDAMVVDQEYRLILLELGVTE